MRLLAVLVLVAACHDDAETATPDASPPGDSAVDAGRDLGPPVTPSEHRLALGGVHSCYLDEGGAAFCWGADDAHQLGSPSNNLSRLVPTSVTVLTRAVEIAAAGGELDGHTLVRVENGDIRGWGANALGQLGDGMDTSPATITTAINMFKGRALVAAARHTCALDIAKKVACWGKNDHGQLQLSSQILGSLSPISPVSQDMSYLQIAVGADHTCALLADGTTHCWGRNQFGQTGATGTDDQRTTVTVPGLTATSAAIGTGYAHSCAIDAAAGGVRCWGANASGQLGDGNIVGSNVAVVVTGLAGPASAVCGGEAYTCARLASGSVQCWGANDQGQLGDGSNTPRLAPVTVTGVSGVVEIACGRRHACARLADGGVRCWGANERGQLGDGTTTARSTAVTAKGLGGVPI